MINFCRTSLVLILLVMASPGFADPWKLQKYPTEHFQVEWSGPVSVSPVKLTPEKKKLVDHSTQYLQDAGSYAYIVASQRNLFSTLFDEGSKSAIDSFNCKSVVQHPLDMGPIKAKEFNGTDCDNNFHIHGRFFADGKNWYQIFAVMDPSSDSDAGKHFVESFKLIDK